MSINAFKDNKCKEEVYPKTNVYTKEEVDAKINIVYSTEEQLIGRWIDGKPLYRAVIVDNGPFSAGGNEHRPLGIANIDRVVNLAGGMAYRADGKFEPLSIYLDTLWGISIIDITPTSYGVYFGSNQAAPEVAITRIEMIIEYTKVTD